MRFLGEPFRWCLVSWCSTRPASLPGLDSFHPSATGNRIMTLNLPSFHSLRNNDAIVSLAVICEWIDLE